jgi:hypothetical protein
MRTPAAPIMDLARRAIGSERWPLASDAKPATPGVGGSILKWRRGSPLGYLKLRPFLTPGLITPVCTYAD